jgi:hypothetical protein
MNQLKNTTAAALLFIAVIIGLVHPAHAVLTLTLESDGSTVSITDGGAGDGGPLSGVFSETQTSIATPGNPYTMALQTVIVATGASASRYDWHRSVPEPPTLLLFGAGLIGVAVWGRRRLKPRAK